jgi:hypothetical protein
MPRRMASSGKAQKYPITAIAIMHRPMVTCVARAMSDTLNLMIRRPFPLRQSPEIRLGHQTNHAGRIVAIPAALGSLDVATAPKPLRGF